MSKTIKAPQHAEFGQRLREERERRGLSQTEFGAVGGVGKIAQLNYEKGYRVPNVRYLSNLRLYGVDVDSLFSGQGQGQEGEAISGNSEHEGLKAWACRSLENARLGHAEPIKLVTRADMAQAIASDTESAFPAADPAVLLEAMWLAMQLVGGPQRAAATLRYCGVNFVNS